MKRFIIRVLIFLSLMSILDRGFGVVMKYLQDHAKGGYIGHHNYILHQANEDVLIFGSSRAIHHYNPQIIEDSLGMSCYNCGQDGNGILLFYGWWRLMENRYTPKMIIYDVNPEFDLLVGRDNHRYLGWLRSEYNNDAVKEVFEEIDPTEKYKMLSMMYRYNSKFLQNVTDYFHPVFQISANGYLPNTGKMNKMKIKDPEPFGDVDKLKVDFLEKFTKDVTSKGILLVYTASPYWYGMNDEVFEPLKAICKKYNISFVNYVNDISFVKNDDMFADGNHLNAHGADIFTSRIATKLQDKIWEKGR